MTISHLNYTSIKLEKREKSKHLWVNKLLHAYFKKKREAEGLAPVRTQSWKKAQCIKGTGNRWDGMGVRRRNTKGEIVEYGKIQNILRSLKL